MGVLGKYLREAREARGLDLHDAAQQTRIGISYLKALEAEDFAKLPGDVFVKGFLKNYGKFLNLPESEVLQKYNETRSGFPVAAAPAKPAEQRPEPPVRKSSASPPIEPLLWGAAIILAVIVFLVASGPGKRDLSRDAVFPEADLHSSLTSSGTTTKPEKLYLQVLALDDVWLLVRTDSGPQKKVLLKKDENVIWSADERFLLSYGNVNAAKLLLNGEELMVTSAKNSVVRDLTLTAAGITIPKEAPDKPRMPRVRRQPQPVPAPIPQPQGDQGVQDGISAPLPPQPELPALTEAPREQPVSPPPAISTTPVQ